MISTRKVDTRDKSWMVRAQCLGQDPLVYDTDDDPKPSPAIQCYVCPVRSECLTYALIGKESGTWGGLSRKQRDQIVSRRRRRRTCPNDECRSKDVSTSQGVGKCARCAVSWYTEPQQRADDGISVVLLNPAGV